MSEPEHQSVQDAARRPIRELVDDRLLDELLARSRDQAGGLRLTGEGSMLGDLVKAVLERALEAELTAHLDYDKHATDGYGTGNSRNGKIAKTVQTGVGPVRLQVPRDRAGTFEPVLVPKRAGRVSGGLDEATHGNLFLAAFAAGVTVATIGHEHREAFGEFGELVAELLKLAALLVFGALLSPAFLGDVGWTGWAFAVLALVVARPVAIWVSFLRSRLTVREQAAVMWFGPKGFASVVYGLLVLESGIAAGDHIFHLVGATIALSFLAHSSTDIIVARSFYDEREVPTWHGRARARLQKSRRAAPASDTADPPADSRHAARERPE